jgi:hypothetical protein
MSGPADGRYYRKAGVIAGPETQNNTMVEPTAIEQDARTAETANLQENRSFQPSHPFSEYAGSAATNRQRYNGDRSGKQNARHPQHAADELLYEKALHLTYWFSSAP